MDEQERQHLEELLQNYRRRLRPLEKRESYEGPRTPPEILMEIEDIRTKIAGIEIRLNPASPPTQTPRIKQTGSEPARVIVGSPPTAQRYTPKPSRSLKRAIFCFLSGVTSLLGLISTLLTLSSTQLSDIMFIIGLITGI